MSKKGKSIQLQHSELIDLVSHFKELPSRDVNTSKVLTLTQVFGNEDFKKEVQSLLNRGYSHAEIALAFTAKCGVSISERQVKYHSTRAANAKKSKKSSGKVTRKVNETSSNPGPIIEESHLKPEEKSSNSDKTSLQVVKTSPAENSEKGVASSLKVAAKAGTFDIDMYEEEI